MLASIVELILALICLGAAGRILIGLIDAQRAPGKRKRSR
jgi:hypothetical protein